MEDQQGNSPLLHDIDEPPIDTFLPATLTFAQGLCGREGVTLNVPAVAAAANAPSSPPAPPAPAAPSAPAPSSAAAATTPENVADGEDLPATDPSTTSAVATASSSEPVSTAPVSPSAFPTSSAFLDEGDGSTPGDAATGLPSSSAPFSTTSSALVFDTNSVIPSATVASYPLSTSTDAFTADAQVPTTTSVYRNSSSTANTTVAASSPIPYVGAAVSGKVQGVGMMMMVVLGVFWGL
ncbi:MAG: hypothetical protein Q9172_005647 [Xanthocarpia lactea]